MKADRPDSLRVGVVWQVDPVEDAPFVRLPGTANPRSLMYRHLHQVSQPAGQSVSQPVSQSGQLCSARCCSLRQALSESDRRVVCQWSSQTASRPVGRPASWTFGPWVRRWVGLSRLGAAGTSGACMNACLQHTRACKALLCCTQAQHRCTTRPRACLWLHAFAGHHAPASGSHSSSQIATVLADAALLASASLMGPL
jgi:hypothetical protein